MPTFFQDEVNVDIIQHTPRVDPVLGRANSPTNGAIWYDIASNSFHGVVNGVVAAIGGGGAPAFSAITAGTNLGQALIIGNGSTLSTSGSGTITATSIPFSGVTVGTNANALVIGTGGSLTTSGTGTITATPGGSTTQVQFNNGGVLAGTAAATIVTGAFTLPTGVTIGQGFSIGIGGGGANIQFSGTDIILTTFGGNLVNIGNGGNNALKLSEVNNTTLAGVTGFTIFAPDVTTHTLSYNSANLGITSLTGAWVNTNVTPVTVAASTTADQNLMSVSIPAGTLNRVGRSLRLWGAGVFSTPAAQTEIVTVKVKLGALTLISIPIPSQSFTATNNQFNISSILSTQTAGATGVFESHGNLVIDLGIGNLVADTIFADQNTAVSSTIDLTVTQTLQVTIAYSVASTSNSTTQRQMVLETIG